MKQPCLSHRVRTNCMFQPGRLNEIVQTAAAFVDIWSGAGGRPCWLHRPAMCGDRCVTACQRINLSPRPPYMGQQCMNVLQERRAPGGWLTSLGRRAARSGPVRFSSDLPSPLTGPASRPGDPRGSVTYSGRQTVPVTLLAQLTRWRGVPGADRVSPHFCAVCENTATSARDAAIFTRHARRNAE